MIDSDYRILKSILSSSNFMHGDLISKYILVVVCAVTTFGVVNSVTAQTNESMMNQTGMNMTAPETLSDLETQILENDTGPATGQSPQSGINWGDLCRNPIVDRLIAEPCETLTSPDGYQLTSEGNRVLYCLFGGGVGKLFGLSDDDLKQLSPVVGCRPQK